MQLSKSSGVIIYENIYQGGLMSKITVVTDSTAYLPDNIIKKLKIKVIPLQVIWDGQLYKDNVDIKSDEFYSRLKQEKNLPTTSQPSPQEFIDLYKPLLEKGNQVISIHISSGISGTINSAVQARSMLETKNVAVVDSKTSGLAMGLVVMKVAEAANNGASFKECKELAEKASEKVDLFFMVDTLEYLHKGGRIGGAAKLLGSALNLKPILTLEDGKIESYDKVRTKKKALLKLVEICKEKVGDERPVEYAIMQVEAEEGANFVDQQLQELFSKSDIKRSIIGGLSPVIGTHTGPGVIALAFLSGM
jgi:DegV family protein with EDD domain